MLFWIHRGKVVLTRVNSNVKGKVKSSKPLPASALTAGLALARPLIKKRCYARATMPKTVGLELGISSPGHPMWVRVKDSLPGDVKGCITAAVLMAARFPSHKAGKPAKYRLKLR